MSKLLCKNHSKLEFHALSLDMYVKVINHRSTLN